MKKDRFQEISQLYHDALELPANERAAFLKACVDEDVQHEVQALLAEETKVRDFLEAPALEVASRMKTKERQSLIGAQLGSYHVISELGRGGMGEVFRAKDQKLQRDVAIKVLPDEFARDADRVSRFQREARLLASLNHPNIAAIHGLEESGGKNFLVLELVEGETLREQLNRGPIPIEESLKLALQIAEALEDAHERGIIHRDLKPANIKVTPDGKVKVLDFGLAKAFAGEPKVNLSDSPTLSKTATQQGVILGTAAYMSPEQARGKSVDKRADIWSFGCVLFEMLTGRAAFQGEDVSDILASVIKGDLHLDLLPASINPRIHEILSHCLQKDLKKRYHDIGDVQFDLEQVLADPGGVLARPIASKDHRTKLQILLPWLATAVALGAIIAGAAVWKLKPAPPPEPRRIIRFEHDLPEDQQLNISAMNGHTIAVSPDGSQFVYSTSKGLYVRSVNEMGARLVPGTDGNPQSPFFSHDGQWLGYWSQTDNRLKKIAVGGGTPVVLCDVAYLFGAIWYADNTIVFSDVPNGIMRISANGGTPQILVKGNTLSPQLLPDGKSILFTAAFGPPIVAVQQLASGKRKELFPGYLLGYLPTGHLVFEQESDIYAVPFNPGTLEVRGGPVQVVQSARLYAISDSGTLVYIPGKTPYLGSGRTLVWVDRSGKEEPLAAQPDYYVSPRISPDGAKVALSFGPRTDSSIRICYLSSMILTRLTLNAGWHNAPMWTPDGRRIVYFSNRESEAPGIYWKSADGIGNAEKLGSAPDRQWIPRSFSSDGKTLVIEDRSKDLLQANIAALSMEGSHASRPLLANALQPKISPDGRWMAYKSSETGQGEIYVCPLPDVDKGRYQVSMGGGDNPLWSPGGRELFYLNGDAIMAVSVKIDSSFSIAGTPKVLFRGTYIIPVDIDGTPWDISPDGKRFLMIKEPRAAAGTDGSLRKINIVLNWIDELKQRVPVK
jgi:eukaryotic-like serine/threonine-protein kinase